MKKILLLPAIGFLLLVVVAHAASAPSALQFRLVMDSPTADSEQMTVVQPNNSPKQPEVLNVQKEVLLDNSIVKNATVVDSGGNPEIDVKLTDDGAKRLAEITQQNIGKRLALVVDGKLYEAPRIATAIMGGEALITGHFTMEEAIDLATKINGSPAGVWETGTKAIPGIVFLLCLVVIFMLIVLRRLGWRLGI